MAFMWLPLQQVNKKIASVWLSETNMIASFTGSMDSHAWGHYNVLSSHIFFINIGGGVGAGGSRGGVIEAIFPVLLFSMIFNIIKTLIISL